MAEVWINVAAYMSGHNHKGNYAHHKGCHYINFKGMVETETTSAYAVVRCFADRIAIELQSMASNQSPTASWHGVRFYCSSGIPKMSSR